MYSLFTLPSSWKDYLPKYLAATPSSTAKATKHGCLRDPASPHSRKRVRIAEDRNEYIEPELPYETQFYSLAEQGKQPDTRVVAARNYIQIPERVSQAWSDDDLADGLEEDVREEDLIEAWEKLQIAGQVGDVEDGEWEDVSE